MHNVQWLTNFTNNNIDWINQLHLVSTWYSMQIVGVHNKTKKISITLHTTTCLTCV